MYWGSPPRDEEFDPPNLLDEGETEDVLTVSLRRLYQSKTVERVHISRMILGQEFYRRPRKEDGGFGDRGKGSEVWSGDEDEDEEEEKGDREDFSDIDDDNDSAFDKQWYRDGGNSDDEGRSCSDLQDLHVDWPKVTADGRWLYERPDPAGADKNCCGLGCLCCEGLSRSVERK